MTITTTKPSTLTADDTALIDDVMSCLYPGEGRIDANDEDAELIEDIIRFLYPDETAK